MNFREVRRTSRKFTNEGGKAIPKRKTPLVARTYYHIYNRAVAGDLLFHSSENYLHFLSLIKRGCGENSISMAAYCLMPNHFHFLLRSEVEETISRFMQGLCSAYTQALNHRLGRRGPLFAGRFQAVPVLEEDYFVHVARYIHRNPVAAHLVNRLEDWAFSNFLDVVGARSGALKDDGLVPTHFSTAEEYRFFVEEGEVDLPSGFAEYALEDS